MLPKIIHYIWLSNDALDPIAQQCISSWKTCLPDYKIRKWSMEDLSRIDNIPDFVFEAIKAQKYAFASDWLRLCILYQNGGWYFDSDVFILQQIELSRFNKFKLVSSVEYWPDIFIESGEKHIDKDGNADIDYVPGLGIQAAIMGSIKGHPFLKDCMDYYNGIHFNNTKNSDSWIIAPAIIANKALKYGFRYFDKVQKLDKDILILSSDIFASSWQRVSQDSIATHLCNASWRNLSIEQRKKQSRDNLIFIKTLTETFFIKKQSYKCYIFAKKIIYRLRYLLKTIKLKKRIISFNNLHKII